MPAAVPVLTIISPSRSTSKPCFAQPLMRLTKSRTGAKETGIFNKRFGPHSICKGKYICWKNKTFWYGNMAFAVLGWIFFFYGLLFTVESHTWKTLWWTVAVLWGIGASVGNGGIPPHWEKSRSFPGEIDCQNHDLRNHVGGFPCNWAYLTSRNHAEQNSRTDSKRCAYTQSGNRHDRRRGRP